MTVDAGRVGETLRQRFDDPAVLALVDQLRDDMDEREYCSIVIGITRLLAAEGRRNGTA